MFRELFVILQPMKTSSIKRTLVRGVNTDDNICKVIINLNKKRMK